MDARYEAAQRTNQGDGRGWDFSDPSFREPANWKAIAPVALAIIAAIIGVAMCGAIQ